MEVCTTDVRLNQSLLSAKKSLLKGRVKKAIKVRKLLFLKRLRAYGATKSLEPKNSYFIDSILHLNLFCRCTKGVSSLLQFHFHFRFPTLQKHFNPFELHLFWFAFWFLFPLLFTHFTSALHFYFRLKKRTNILWPWTVASFQYFVSHFVAIFFFRIVCTAICERERKRFVQFPQNQCQCKHWANQRAKWDNLH